MDRRYNLKDLALMTGFTDRTLRNYLLQGLLKGQKVDGVWQFTLQEVDEFFQEPFVKEGLRTKRNGIVYDYLADRKKKTPRTYYRFYSFMEESNCIFSSWSEGD